MKLQKQLSKAFLTVSMLPLLLVSLFLFGTSINLAFHLYERNLLSSVEIQADLVTESIHRMMVRAGNFASARSVADALDTKSSLSPQLDNEFANEVMKFTDETLDSISIFALIGIDNQIIYASGSNHDTKLLTDQLSHLAWGASQSVFELALDRSACGLSILSPVMKDGQLVGGVLVLYRPDFFLKTISTHTQIQSTNAFLYCLAHHETVVSKIKQTSTLPLAELEQRSAQRITSALHTTIDGASALCQFQAIAKTDWVLVNSIPTAEIFSLLWSYGFISVLLLTLSLVLIYLLSRRQSRKILEPLSKLLTMVRNFFVSGATVFVAPELDPKTEIGYLATQFADMSNDVAAAQANLQESNYLYQTLLRATYEQRITLDIEAGTLTASSEQLSQRLNRPGTGSPSQRVLGLLDEDRATEPATLDTLRHILSGSCTTPMDIELCCNLNGMRLRWYRMLFVPIVRPPVGVVRLVLHFEDIHDKKLEELRLIRSSERDPLCGLLNKRAFLSRYAPSLAGTTDALFFIDLDEFKQVNDQLGHIIGDEILVAAAQALRTQFRASDTLGRYGGDEFIVFAAGMSLRDVQGRAEQLRKAISFIKTDQSGQITLHVTASIGICMTHSPTPFPQALAVADAAMYTAKHQGKANYHIAYLPSATNTTAKDDIL